MGTVFPLFTAQMYHTLNFRWGGTLIAFIAAALAPIPFVLFWYGPRIRARSKFACGLVEKGEEEVRRQMEEDGMMKRPEIPRPLQSGGELKV